MGSTTKLVAVIIPARNEERTIAGVVDVARRASFVTEVLVVDNGSTDGTVKVASSHGARVVDCVEVGKSQAVARGLGSLNSEPDAVVLLDADLRGLRIAHLEAMVSSLDRHEMVCGVLTDSRIRNRLLRTKRGRRMSTLTGQRALSAQLVTDFDWSRCKGYDLETRLFRYFKRTASIYNIPIKGVTHTRREDKVKGLSKVERFLTRVRVALTYVALWIIPRRSVKASLRSE